MWLVETGPMSRQHRLSVVLWLGRRRGGWMYVGGGQGQCGAVTYGRYRRGGRVRTGTGELTKPLNRNLGRGQPDGVSEKKTTSRVGEAGRQDLKAAASGGGMTVRGGETREGEPVRVCGTGGGGKDSDTKANERGRAVGEGPLRGGGWAEGRTPLGRRVRLRPSARNGQHARHPHRGQRCQRRQAQPFLAIRPLAPRTARHEGAGS